MATNDIGRVTPIWRGFYSAGATYELNDIVIDTAGSVWWHKSPEVTTGVTPAAGAIWAAVIDMDVFSGLIADAIAQAQAALEAAEGAVAEVTADTERAETAAENAEASALSASESAAGVGALAQAAEAAKTAAQTAASQAAASASSAGTSAASAGSSAQAAETSKTAAQTAAAQAAGSAETASGAAAVVEQKKAEAIAAIEEKGEEVLESIPEDYTELSGDVGALKESIGELETTIGKDISYTGSITASPTKLIKTTIIDDILIPAGTIFTLALTTTPDTPGEAMFTGALTVYYDTGTTLGTYYPDRAEPYTVTAPADIHSLQVYKTTISAAGTITANVGIEAQGGLTVRMDDAEDDITALQGSVSGLSTTVTGIDTTVHGEKKQASGSISVSGSKLNKTLLVDDIFIPADTEYKITVNATEGVIASGGAVTLYYKDKDGNYGTAQQFLTAKPGETYTRIAPADMYAIYAYKATISAEGAISAELEWGTVSVESRLQALDKAGELPEYYNDTGYIQAKANRITELAQSCAGNGLVFAFVTDEHWNYNAKHSPALLRYLYEHTHLPVLINGGDSGNGVQINAIDKFRTYFPGKMYNVPGNHDWYNGNNASGMNKVYYAFDMFNNDQVTGNAMEHYCYVDNVQQKIRFIMLNAFLWDSQNPTTAKTGYNADQLAWLTGEALTAPAGWDYIVFTHYIGTTTRDTTPEGVGNFRGALDAYNADSSHTGKVLAIIQGHGHYDAVYHTAGGIPIALVTCDKYYPFVRTVDGVTTDMEPWISEYRILGTRTEQAFDVFVLDRENRKFTAVRIGCPAMDNVDVEITDTEHFDKSPTLEEREVSYAGLYPSNP